VSNRGSAGAQEARRTTYEDGPRLSKPPLPPNDADAGAGAEVRPIKPDDWRCDPRQRTSAGSVL